MIFFLCPELPYPTGGVKQIHLQAAALQSTGQQVAILYVGSARPCLWFPVTVPCWQCPPWMQQPQSRRVQLVRWLKRLLQRRERPARPPRLAPLPAPPTDHDLLVVPEIFAASLGELPPSTPKLILNQNCFLSFHGLDSTSAMPFRSLQDLYRTAGVIGQLANSPYGEAYLRWAFPGIPTQCLELAVNVPPTVSSLEQREPQLVFFPRKSPDVVQQVLGILRNRGALQGWRLMPLVDLTEVHVEQMFRQSRLYVACSLQEGLGLPPLEAMANGCAVVGFPAWGGDAFLTEAYASPVRTGDVLALAAAVEQCLGELLTQPASWQARVDRARAMVQERHNHDRAHASTRAAFGMLLKGEAAV